MEIKCIKCNQEFYLPDSETNNKKFFFYCSNCNHKIVIDRRNNQVTPEIQIEGNEVKRTISNILSGIKDSFNIKGFLTSFIYILFVSIFLFTGALIFGFNPDLLASNPKIIGFFGALLLIGIIYCGYLTQYIISKIYFIKLNGSQKKLSEELNFSFGTDALSIFLMTIATTISFVILLFPLIVISKHGLLYGGFIFPVLFFLIVIIQLFFLLGNLLPALLAYEFKPTPMAIKGIFKFLVRENLNIPVYGFVIKMIVLIVNLFLSGIVYIAIFFTAGLSLISSMVPNEKLFTLSGALTAPFAGTLAPALESITSISNADKVGLVIILFFVVIILLSFIAYIFNLTQCLATHAIQIIQTNPEKSIKRSVMLFIILCFGLLNLLLSIAFIFIIK